MKLSTRMKFAAIMLAMVFATGVFNISGIAHGQDLTGTVTASGSTALLPLLKAAQQGFQNMYPDVTINIAGGGSFTGQNQVASGAVNIGDSDVDLAPALIGQGLVRHWAVGEPFIFIANPDVTVNNLTQQQYIGIFTGRITNWSQVGGRNEAITIIHRAQSSGSRKTIENVVLNGAPFTDNAIIQDSTGAVRAAVASTPGAIGYVDAAYLNSTVKPLAYNGVGYCIANVENHTYPVYAVGRMYTKGQPSPVVAAFIQYVQSAAFQQQYAMRLGYVPLYSLHLQ